ERVGRSSVSDEAIKTAGGTARSGEPREHHRSRHPAKQSERDQRSGPAPPLGTHKHYDRRAHRTSTPPAIQTHPAARRKDSGFTPPRVLAPPPVGLERPLVSHPHRMSNRCAEAAGHKRSVHK